MFLLQPLRNAKSLARLVLVWFVLSLGVAVASPVVNPQVGELVCSSTGVMKLIITNVDGSQETADVGGSHLLDCPLCASASAPPPTVTQAAPTQQALSYALQSIPAARIAALVGAPLPARGPPHNS